MHLFKLTLKRYSETSDPLKRVKSNQITGLLSLLSPFRIPYKLWYIERILHGHAGIWILSLSAESISREWAKQTSERYFQHSKIKFVSPSGHVMFCLFYGCWWNSYIKHNFFLVHFRNSKILQLKWSPIAKCLSQKCYETRI